MATKKFIDFTIGADPEFSAERNGDVVGSSEFTNRNSTVLEFGSDGNGVTFELRPSASKNPLEVVHNIRRIFIQKVMERPDFLKVDWVSGSWHKGYPLGGHVHFGLSQNQVNYNQAIDVLDHYVGIVSLLLEDKEDARRRRKEGYGSMSDMRIQPWGFEYRAMSSWISSPYVASAMLCLSKTVMFEFVNNSKFQWNKYALPEYFKNPVDRESDIKNLFPTIWNEIKQMKLYQVYKPYLDLIYFIVTNNITWLPSAKMSDSWAIANVKPVTKKCNVDILWQRFNNER